jgi:S1-C subfamily serine protease
MIGVEWIITGAVVLLALLGYSQGFLAGALSLGGFALGAWLGTRLGPQLLADGSQSPYAPLFALAGAVLAGAVLAAGFEGVASKLRMGMRLAPGLGLVDGLLGALLTGALGLLIAWVIGTIALQTPGARSLRRDFQRSEILSRLNDVLPSRTLLNALARFDPFPRVTGPGIDVGPPDAAIARDPDVRRAGRSVVRILGTACGLGVQGSGWVASPGIVVTNAHVVAGEQDTEVQPGGEGPTLRAHAVHFDSRNDIAVLRVAGMGARALALAPHPASGSDGAILGFPEDGPFDVRAARLGPTRRVVTQDAYGHGPVQRSLTSLRGTVRPGNSGGPVVDGRGRVLTTVFAATTRSPRGGYGVPNSLVRRALRDTSRTVSTGSCAR